MGSKQWIETETVTRPSRCETIIRRRTIWAGKDNFFVRAFMISYKPDGSLRANEDGYSYRSFSDEFFDDLEERSIKACELVTPYVGRARNKIALRGLCNKLYDVAGGGRALRDSPVEPEYLLENIQSLQRMISSERRLAALNGKRSYRYADESWRTENYGLPRYNGSPGRIHYNRNWVPVVIY